MRLSYVLPDPASYRDWSEFDGDLACLKQAGYDAVELQIADPSLFDEDRVRRSLQQVGYSMLAFQTGSTYSSRGNCLCTADEAVRRRTIELLKSFVALASRWDAVIVFGSLQGRLRDEPDRRAGETRIREAIREVGEYAVERRVKIAFEPVNHGEVGFHNTIAEVAELVRGFDLPSVRMMIDTFHMNIEERDMLAPLSGIREYFSARPPFGDQSRHARHGSLADCGPIGGIESVGLRRLLLDRRLQHSAKPTREYFPLHGGIATLPGRNRPCGWASGS